MKLQHGQEYVLQNGERVTVYSSGAHRYPFCGRRSDGSVLTWTENGKFDVYNETVCSLDIVQKYAQPKPKKSSAKVWAVTDVGMGYRRIVVVCATKALAQQERKKAEEKGFEDSHLFFEIEKCNFIT